MRLCAHLFLTVCIAALPSIRFRFRASGYELSPLSPPYMLSGPLIAKYAFNYTRFLILCCEEQPCDTCAAVSGNGTQRLQNPLIEEYTLNLIKGSYYNLR